MLQRRQGPFLDPSIKNGFMPLVPQYLQRYDTPQPAMPEQKTEELRKSNVQQTIDWNLIEQLNLSSATPATLRKMAKDAANCKISQAEIKSVGSRKTAKLIQTMQAIITALTSEKDSPKNHAENTKISPRFNENNNMQANNGAFECRYCKNRKFMSEKYLQSHYDRRHPEHNNLEKTPIVQISLDAKNKIGEARELLATVMTQITNPNTKIVPDTKAKTFIEKKSDIHEKPLLVLKPIKEHIETETSPKTAAYPN